MGIKINRKGEGAFSLLVTIIIIAIVGAIVWQVVGTLYERYEISLGLERASAQATLLMSDEEIWTIGQTEFRKLKLSKEHIGKNIIISRKYDKITLIYEYVVEIGIPFTPIKYPWTLHTEG